MHTQQWAAAASPGASNGQGHQATVSGCVPGPRWGKEARPGGLTTAGSACGLSVYTMFSSDMLILVILSTFSFTNSLVQNKQISTLARTVGSQQQQREDWLHTGQARYPLPKQPYTEDKPHCLFPLHSTCSTSNSPNRTAEL